MATHSNQSIHFPLQMLGRAVKQKPTFLLGLCGVQAFKNGGLSTATVTETMDDSPWSYSLNMVVASMADQWGTAPALVPQRELLGMVTPSANSRNRYGDAESIARWRAIPLCVLDLGCDNRESVKRFGRQCDGVAMIVLGSLNDAKKQLHQLRGDAIPWVGYWTLSFLAHSEDNCQLETARKIA